MTTTVDSVDHLQHFVRAWPGQVATRRTESTRVIPDRFLVFDTETTTDETQRLTFGTFFVGSYVNGRAVPCGEGIIYADDLPESDPDGYRLLQEHVKANPLARVEIGHVGNIAVDPLVRLVSRTEFIYRYFYPLGMETSKRHDAKPAAVVGFNLPFDLSRIANNVGPAKGGSAGGFRNGFSFEMMPGRPNVRTNSMGSKGMVYQFQGRLEKNPAYRAIPLSTFIDVATLVFALTGRPMSLSKACERFRVPFGKDKVERHGVITPEYIWYARNDARATMGLYEATSNELYRHNIAVSANKAYSPASIAKAYLEEMGILRPLVGNKEFPQEMHGYATAGFYGGRSEVMARRVPVPVALYDFTSMYPTVNALLGMWELLKADHIEPREETDAVRMLLSGITLDTCFDPATWRNVVGFAKVKLEGDVVPIRATYGESPTPTIGLNYAYSDDPMWYSIPDLIASTLLTGKVPEIETAYRLYPVGENKDLKTIDIRGVTFNPHDSDFFVYLIEKRQELRTEHKKVCEQFRTSSDSSCDCEESNLIEFLKVLANSGCYGVFVEMNRQEHDDAQDTSLYGISGVSWEMPVERPEKAGQYCFPAIGVVITSAARLMLAMLERCVTDSGGVWAFCDTDSMCIVSSASGATVYDQQARPIPVLTYDAVEAIRARFDSLSPYDRIKVPTLLKCETQDYIDAGVELYGHCISAKRYALYKREGDTVTIVKRTEHGLGAYLNPHDPDIQDEKGKRAWVDDIWEYLIRCELVDAGLLTTRPKPPEWTHRPTMMRRTVTTWGVYESPMPGR